MWNISNISSSLDLNEAWSWNGWTNFSNNSRCRAGTIDAMGSLILVGETGEQDSEDFAAVKLLNSGEVLWTWTNSTSGTHEDIWFAVDTDRNNDVIMGGRSEGSLTDLLNDDQVAHIAAAKLDGDTQEVLWWYQNIPEVSTSISSPGEVLGVAVDTDDNIYLAGRTFGSLEAGEGDPGDSDAFVIKLNGTSGSEMWIQQFGEVSDPDLFYAVESDSAGNLVVAGVTGQSNVSDYIVLKLSGATGIPEWDYSLPSASTDSLLSVDVDAERDVYAAGSAAETPIVLKLDGSTGDRIWIYEDTAPSSTYFRSVGVDPVTGVVVGAGATAGTWVAGSEQGRFDFAAVVLDGTTGDELARYQNGTSGTDGLFFGGFDGQGGLLVGGFTTTPEGDPDMIAIKFEGDLEDEEPFWEWLIGYATDAITSELGRSITAGVCFLLLILLCCCARSCCRRCCRRKPPDQPTFSPTPPPTYAHWTQPQAPPSPKPQPQAPPSPSVPWRRQQQVMDKKEFADRAFKSGSYQLAYELYSEAITMADQKDTETKAALFANRAAALMNLGRSVDAIRDCEQALRLEPDYPKVLLRKGRLHMRLGQWDLAIQALETCCSSAKALPSTKREATIELEQCRRSKPQPEPQPEPQPKPQPKPIRSIDHYATLGIKSSATTSEVRKAYHELALVHHPDKNNGDPESAKRFKAIKNAFEALMDEAKRRA